MWRGGTQLTSNDCTSNPTTIFCVVSYDITERGPNIQPGGTVCCTISTHSPLSPKTSWSPSCTLSANPGYFCPEISQRFIQFPRAAILTLYKEPSAPTEHPSSKRPFLFTIAAIPQALSLAERFPISLASARKNCRSARVVSRAKKCVKIPMIINNSSVGSL